MYGSFPKLNLDVLSAEDRKIAEGIINSRTGLLRASSPKHDLNSGWTQYIWRMIAFYTSPNAQHHCMPCTTDCYVEFPEKTARQNAMDKYYKDNGTYGKLGTSWWDTEEYKELGRLEDEAKKVLFARLNKIVDTLTDTVPLSQQHGVKRWGKAFFG